MLTREQILAAPLRLSPVDVPEWGGVVNVRELTLGERLAIEKMDAADAGAVILRVVVAAACGDDGLPLFTADDLPALAGASPNALKRVVDAAKDLNALDDDDIEEIAGKSTAGRTNGSPTGSPAILA